MRQQFSKIRPAYPGDVSIETNNAWVQFPIFDAKSRSLKKTFVSKAGGTIGRSPMCLSSMRQGGPGRAQRRRQVHPAEAASGIYEPTRGSAAMRGRVAPIFDLGLGMDPEISGYENIIIRGLFLGENRRSMLSKIDEIAEFTELGAYLSMPLRTYSTGMRVRLAIGVVTSIDPEILLFDEAIGALDGDFLMKAQVKLDDLVKRCGILVVAAHSRQFLARLCKTGIWLDRGTINLTGGIDEVLGAYRGDGAACRATEIVR